MGRAPATTSTHTVACVDDTDCRYAYSAGDSGSDSFSVFDLRRLGQPREVDADPDRAGVQPFRSPTAGHKWNFDAAGIGTHTGFDGSSMWDVERPRHPRLLATTGRAGGAGDASGADGYNDFIHHNSFRPNAAAFTPNSAPSLRNGNILLVTEEDYEQTDCTRAGSFQTWHVKRLDGGAGGIVPLDKVELSDLGSYPLPQGAFCSAHWFDYRPGGIVAIGYYGGGTQLIDVREPKRLEAVRPRVLGRQRGLGRDVGAALRRRAAADRRDQQRRLRDRPGARPRRLQRRRARHGGSPADRRRRSRPEPGRHGGRQRSARRAGAGRPGDDAARTPSLAPRVDRLTDGGTALVTGGRRD